MALNDRSFVKQIGRRRRRSDRRLWLEADVTPVLQPQMEPRATQQQGKNEQAANSIFTLGY